MSTSPKNTAHPGISKLPFAEQLTIRMAPYMEQLRDGTLQAALDKIAEIKLPEGETKQSLQKLLESSDSNLQKTSDVYNLLDDGLTMISDRIGEEREREEKEDQEKQEAQVEQEEQEQEEQIEEDEVEEEQEKQEQSDKEETQHITQEVEASRAKSSEYHKSVTDHLKKLRVSDDLKHDALVLTLLMLPKIFEKLLAPLNWVKDKLGDLSDRVTDWFKGKKEELQEDASAVGSMLTDSQGPQGQQTVDAGTAWGFQFGQKLGNKLTDAQGHNFYTDWRYKIADRRLSQGKSIGPVAQQIWDQYQADAQATSLPKAPQVDQDFSSQEFNDMVSSAPSSTPNVSSTSTVINHPREVVQSGSSNQM